MTDRIPTAASVDDPSVALDPVRLALLEDAASEADQIIADASRVADQTLAEAEMQVREETERAEHRRETSARARANQMVERARSDTRRRILRAQRDVHRRLVDTVRERTLGLRDDIRYPALLDELERLARDQLGPETTIERDPGQVGGIIATAGPRRVDYTLPALADRALGAIADEVVELWT